MAGKPAELRLGAQCALQCAPCDCRYSASTPAQVERTLKEGGPRLVLRGAPTGEDELGALLARATGFAELIVRSACHEFAAVPRATALARAGAHGVILPAFSHVPEVHDRIAGRKDALVHSLLGVRALVAAGLSAELEVPILSARLQNPEALVELWHRAVPTLRAIRFFAPRHELPAAIAPSPWPQASAGLAAAAAALWAATPKERVKLKQEPSPASLTTSIWPPMRPTSCWLIASPRPVPPYWRVVELSAWQKAINKFDSCSGVMPMPVSVTEKRRLAASAPAAVASTSRLISPLSVNFKALFIRLIRT